jgi:hypothetical protein
MSDQENEILEGNVEETKVPHTGGSGVPAAEVPGPVGAGAKKRKADKDGGDTATPKMDDKGTQSGTKAAVVSELLARVNDMSKDELSSLVAEMTKEESEEQEEIVETELDVTEDIQAMLAAGDFEEEFVENLQTVFGAAVAARVAKERADLEEGFETKLAEGLEAVQTELTEKVDDYLSYAVNEWTEDNEVAIESGIRMELAEDFITGMRDLFAEHYINVPEEKVDVVEELATKVEDLEEKLNKQITENAEISKEVAQYKVAQTFDEVVEGLADTQVEKMRTMAEGIEFSDEDDFRKKMEVVRENYFPTKAPEAIVEEDLDDPVDQEEVVTDPAMSVYADAIRRTIKK